MKQIHKKNFERAVAKERRVRSFNDLPPIDKATYNKLFEELYEKKQAVFEDILYYIHCMDGGTPDTYEDAKKSLEKDKLIAESMALFG